MKRFLFLIIAGYISLLNQGYAFFGNYDGCNCRGFQGLYVGGNLGWAAWDHAWVDRTLNSTDPFIGFPSTHDDFTAGVQLGYNYQCGCALFGIEADGNWIDLKRTKESIVYTLNDSSIFVPLINLTTRDRLDWFGTIRGRAGIVANNLLLFATAGASWANFRNEIIESEEGGIIFPDDVTHILTTKKTHWGLALGLGVEWMVSSAFSIKAEGLYLKFPETHVREHSALLQGNEAFYDFLNAIWVARAGINFNLSSLWL